MLQRGSPQPIIAHWWNCATRRTPPLAAFTARLFPARPGSVIIIEPSRIIVIERRDARTNNKLRPIDPSRTARRDAIHRDSFCLMEHLTRTNDESTLNCSIKKQPFYLSKLGFSRWFLLFSNQTFVFCEIICWIAYAESQQKHFTELRIKSWYHLYFIIHITKLLQNFSEKSSKN